MAIHQLFDAHWKLKLMVRVKIVDECFSRWPQLLEHTPHYEFGCGAGQQAVALARRVSVECWDHETHYKQLIQALNLPWCEPARAQPQVCWLGSVLVWVDQEMSASVWLETLVTQLRAPWWVFRETLNEFVHPQLPSTLHTPGWSQTREIIAQVPLLNLIDEFEVECTEPDGERVTHRVVLCKLFDN